jgi:hypothetical protein
MSFLAAATDDEEAHPRVVEDHYPSGGDSVDPAEDAALGA